MINARAETLAEKPASARCWASTAASWSRMASTSGVGPDGKKQPIHFRLADGGPFAFAGLWTSRTPNRRAGRELHDRHHTPNELVAPVHDRMPVILPLELEAEWLDPEVSKSTRSRCFSPILLRRWWRPPPRRS